MTRKAVTLAPVRFDEPDVLTQQRLVLEQTDTPIRVAEVRLHVQCEAGNPPAHDGGRFVAKSNVERRANRTAS